jgi:hypothetical protein
LLPIHPGSEAREELDAAGVLVGRVVLGEVIAKRPNRECAGEGVDDRVGDDVSVRVCVEPVREVGEVDAAEHGSAARMEPVKVVAPTDPKHASMAIWRGGDVEIRRAADGIAAGRAWSLRCGASMHSLIT